MLIVTINDLVGYKVIQHFGVVRGNIAIRSGGIFNNFLLLLQTIFGGNWSVYANLAERARQDSYDLMVLHAENLGANAIIGMQYDATEIIAGITEVLSYGTAVRIIEA